MKYNYSQFKQQIVSSLQKQLGTETRITIQDIVKNNDTHLDGLTILPENSCVCPTIYLNYYFQKYENGCPISEITGQILAVYRENLPASSIDFSFFTDYTQVRSNIVFKLINYERNPELLSDVPHYRFLDLALVFYCLIETSPDGCASILIHNRHLSYWNITDDDLFALAQQNTPRLLAYELRDMTDVLRELFASILIHNRHLSYWNITDDDLFALAQQNTPRLLAYELRDMTDVLRELFAAEPSVCEDDDSLSPASMYILTNRAKRNGSVCILYDNLLLNFANRLGCDLFILPSSIHEVLLIPANSQTETKDLSEVVREVNSCQLSREEILSDHVYYFSRETGRLTM